MWNERHNSREWRGVCIHRPARKIRSLTYCRLHGKIYRGGLAPPRYTPDVLIQEFRKLLCASVVRQYLIARDSGHQNVDGRP
jgi:hypothetical protein